MYLLLLVDKGVVLSDTTKGKLVHKVDLMWIVHVLGGESLDRSWEGSTEEHDLAILWVELEEILDNWCELWGEKLVGLIHDEHSAFAEICHAFASKILNSAWSANNDMDRLVQSNNVVAETSTSSSDHDV